MKILMVCLGNICRSPLAEGILTHKTKHLNVSVDSAGTSAYHIDELPDKRSIEIASKYNIDLSNQRARQFSQKDFEDLDEIITRGIKPHFVKTFEDVLPICFPNLKGTSKKKSAKK